MLRCLTLATAVAICLGVFSPCLAQTGADIGKPQKSSVSNRSKGKQTPKVALKTASSEEMTELILGDSLHRLWVETDRHFHEGEYVHAVGLNRIIVQGDPSNFEAYATASWLLWSLGQTEPSIAILKQGIAVNPNDSYLYDELGKHYLINLKDHKNAIPYLEAATKLPCHWTTWNLLGTALEKANQWEKAVKVWEKASEFADNRVAPRRLRQAKDKLTAEQGKENR